MRPLDGTGRDYEKTRPNKGGNWKQKRQVSLGKRIFKEERNVKIIRVPENRTQHNWATAVHLFLSTEGAYERS